LKQAGRKPTVAKSKPAPPDEFDRVIEEVQAVILEVLLFAVKI
jgi:hypothetical protein